MANTYIQKNTTDNVQIKTSRYKLHYEYDSTKNAESRFCKLIMIVVEEDFRRNGIAKKVIETLLDECKKNDLYFYCWFRSSKKNIVDFVKSLNKGRMILEQEEYMWIYDDHKRMKVR